MSTTSVTQTKVTKTSKPPRASSSAPPPRKPKKKKGPGGPLAQYLKSAGNAFMYPSPLLGFNSFTSRGQASAWYRVYGMGLAGATCAAIILRPRVMIAGVTTGKFGVADQSYVSIMTDSSGNSLLNNTAVGAGALTQAAPINTANLISRSYIHMVETASLRLTVRYPMTQAPGRLFAFNFFDTDANIGSKSYNNLVALDAAKPVAFSGSGVAQLQINWRMQDDSDVTGAVTNGSPANNIVTSGSAIVAVGWPGGTTFDVDAITFIEYESGSLSAGDSSDNPAMLGLDCTPQQLSRKVQKVPDRLGNAEILACQASALRTAVSAHNSSREAGAARGNTVRRNLGSVAEEMAEASSSGSGGTMADYVNVGLSGLGSVATGVLSVGAALAEQRLRERIARGG